MTSRENVSADTRDALAAYEADLDFGKVIKEIDDAKDCIKRRLDQAKQDGNRGGPRILRQDHPARFVPDSSAPVADAEAHDVATRDAIRRYKQDPGKEKLRDVVDKRIEGVNSCIKDAERDKERFMDRALEAAQKAKMRMGGLMEEPWVTSRR